MTTILQGDALEVLRTLPGESTHCVVTSPPYWGLRDYGIKGQLGGEKTPEEYVARLVEVLREVRRVLRPDGTLWLNLGDTYARRGGNDKKGSAWQGPKRRPLKHSPNRKSAPPLGLKDKDLVGIPWMVAFALRADGWWLRQEIIWAKGTSGLRREGNVLPESTRDRCTRSHEQVFLLSKSARYYFDRDAIAEPARDWGTRDRSRFRGGTTDPKLRHHGLTDCSRSTGNRRSVWRVNPVPSQGGHFAAFPPKLIEPCVLAGCREGDIVLDPFIGSGTTALVCARLRRHCVGIDLNPDYCEMARERGAAP